MAFLPIEEVWTCQPPVGTPIDRSNIFGAAAVVATDQFGRNVCTDEAPTISGSRLTTVNVNGAELRLNTSSALRYSKLTGIGNGDFLATLCVCKMSSTTFEYVLSGSIDYAGGLHIALEHSTSGGQWSVVGNGLVNGSGNVLTVGRRYILSILRIGTTIYLFQDGMPTATPSFSTGSTQVFLDGAWSINEYRPALAYNADSAIAHISVLKGTFSIAAAKQLAANPWQIFQP